MLAIKLALAAFMNRLSTHSLSCVSVHLLRGCRHAPGLAKVLMHPDVSMEKDNAAPPFDTVDSGMDLDVSKHVACVCL